MLYKPVYVQGKKMHQALIPVGPVKKPPSPPPPPPQPPEEPQPPAEPQAEMPEEEERKEKFPMLVCSPGVTAVFPKEATRDVLTGKVAYYLVDERGVTLFEPKHILTALKLNKERVERYEDYPCIGGHQRILERKPVERKGLGYRRRYISPELIGRGIYGSDGSWGTSRSRRTMSSAPLYRGYTGPRA